VPCRVTHRRQTQPRDHRSAVLHLAPYRIVYNAGFPILSPFSLSRRSLVAHFSGCRLFPFVVISDINFLLPFFPTRPLIFSCRIFPLPNFPLADFPLPFFRFFSVVLISDVIFCCHFSYPLIFRCLFFPVAQFSGNTIFRCHFSVAIFSVVLISDVIFVAIFPTRSFFATYFFRLPNFPASLFSVALSTVVFLP